MGENSFVEMALGIVEMGEVRWVWVLIWLAV